MRKSFIKIICVITAAISACGAAFLTACGGDFTSPALPGDRSGEVVSNGGFLVEKGEYVYFINGSQQYTADNTYGNPLKGSIQRISKQDLKDRNYANTQTVVPLVVYSGNNDGGIYIFGDYIYYTTPATTKNSDGVTQNQYLEFKRTKLDGSVTMGEGECYYRASDNSINYRYVKAGEEEDAPVYLVYSLSESLYGKTATNIHSIEISTKKDRVIAYNVTNVYYDTARLDSPYIYYTMDVPKYLGTDDESTESYNQIYRVSADAKTSAREYDFSDIDSYDKNDNPLYINYGELVYDGIGVIPNGNDADNRITQFNANYNSDTHTEITHYDYSYTINRYENGVLNFTIRDTVLSSESVYTLDDAEFDGAEDWDAIAANDEANLLLTENDITNYHPVTFDLGGDTVSRVVYSSGDGIMVGEIKSDGSDRTLQNEYCIAKATSPDILKIAEETTLDEEGTGTETKLYIYYSVSGSVYRVSADSPDVNRLPETDDDYNSVKILDIVYDTTWYAPEFVEDTHTFVFLSNSAGMGGYGYLMACDLTGADGEHVMSNKEIYDLTEKMDGVFESIDEKYGDEDLDAYDSDLASALKYLFYTGDTDYMSKLNKAYLDVEGEEDKYSQDAVRINGEYATQTGDWADYADDYKTVNNKEVYANYQDYYYSLLGRMTKSDSKDLADNYKSSYMLTLPQAASTSWWDGLSIGAKIGFIIGMVVAGLVVVAGITVLTIWLVRRSKDDVDYEEEDDVEIDITDDKSIDVYTDDSEISQESGEENSEE